MCWNFQTSIVSFGIGLVTSIALVIRHRRDPVRYKNDVILIYLILTYSVVQLAEAMMWKDLACKKKVAGLDLNQSGSYVAYLSLAAHPLAIAAGIYQVYREVFPLVIALIIFAYWLVVMPRKMNCAKPQKDGHLVWGFEPDLYLLNFTVGAAMALYFVRPISYAVVILAFYLTTLAFSILLSPGRAAGSNWCWMSAFLAPLAFVATQFIK